MQELEKILEEIDRSTDECGMVDYINDEPVISKKKAKNIIRKHLSHENTPEITRSPQDTEDGWVLVDDQFPENGYDVLVQWEFYSRCDNMTYTYIHIMRLNKMTGEWNGTYGVPNGKVIAWRPLPEPYAGKE